MSKEWPEIKRSILNINRTFNILFKVDHASSTNIVTGVSIINFGPLVGFRVVVLYVSILHYEKSLLFLVQGLWVLLYLPRIFTPHFLSSLSIVCVCECVCNVLCITHRFLSVLIRYHCLKSYTNRDLTSIPMSCLCTRHYTTTYRSEILYLYTYIYK